MRAATMDKRWTAIWQVLEDAEWLATDTGPEVAALRESSPGEPPWTKSFARRAREARDQLLEIYDGIEPSAAHGRPGPPPRWPRKLADGRLERRGGAAEPERSHDLGLLTALGKVTHEIRSPLNTILGFGELLLESVLNADQMEWVGAQQRAASQILRLADDLLDLVHVEAGRFSLESIEFDLIALLEDVARATAVRCRMKRVDVFLKAPSGLPRRVIGDPSRLRQVLDNLLENAIKFTERGHVLLDVGWDGGEPAAMLFRVADTGIGIARDHLASVFEPFEQEGAAIHRRYGGSGLGLAIARDLVIEMGGDIAVESEVGRGTTFRFALPLAAGAADGKGDHPLAGRSILVVDGKHVASSGIPDLLDAWGADITTVGQREGLLARLKGNGTPPCPIVLDVSAREPGGQLTVAALPTAHPAHRRTILVLPLRATLGDAGAARRLEFAAKVPTPLQRAELLAALNRVSAATLPL